MPYKLLLHVPSGRKKENGRDRENKACLHNGPSETLGLAETYRIRLLMVPNSVNLAQCFADAKGKGITICDTCACKLRAGLLKGCGKNHVRAETGLKIIHDLN